MMSKRLLGKLNFHIWKIKIARRPLAGGVYILFFVFLLAGCGQTGPLYLPSQQLPQQPKKTTTEKQTSQSNRNGYQPGPNSSYNY